MGATAVDARIGRSLFDPSIRLPAFVLRERRSPTTSTSSPTSAAGTGISFAPHGKTTMSPAIFRRQVDAGAWAITVAHPWQAEVALDAGIERILIANEVVDDAGLDWIGDVLDGDGPELLVLVDSVAGVERMARRLAGRRRPLPVLIDVGVRGGRTGVRTVDEAEAVAAAESSRRPRCDWPGSRSTKAWSAATRRDARRRAVRGMTIVDREIVDAPRAAARPVRDRRDRRHRRRQHVSRCRGRGAGRPWTTALPVRVVLRSGAYVTHDHGLYERGSPFGMRAAPGAPRLEPAIEVWAPVVSAPEPGLAIAGAGRRDLPVDQDLPVVIEIRGDDGSSGPPSPGFRVDQLNDQHAFIDLDGGARLAVGDLVGFGISHPCTAFQLWREALVVDDEDRIIDVYELRFSTGSSVSSPRAPSRPARSPQTPARCS